jgi:ribosomal protein S18 acetylase RimI-like enzyme
MIESEESGSPIFRLVNNGDIARLQELMEQAASPASGLSSPALYAAMCRDALPARRLLIGVVECDDEIAGHLVMVINWRAYWGGFLIRHPILGYQMLRNRFRRRGRGTQAWDALTPNQRRQIEEVVQATPSGRAWSDSAPTIAKGWYLGIEPAFRRRGLAIQLYRFLFSVLVQRGVTRVDACVDFPNANAIPLHQRLGYRLEKQSTNIFATIDLDRQREQQPVRLEQS